MSSKEEFSVQTLAHLNEYIKFADQKASILLTGQLAFLGLFVNFLNSIQSSPNAIFQISSALSIGATLISGLFAVWVIYPQTEPSGESLLFWENIQSKSKENYSSGIYSLDEGSTLDEIIEENYVLAKIASNKYSRLKSALIATVGTLIFGVTSVLSFVWAG